MTLLSLFRSSPVLYYEYSEMSILFILKLLMCVLKFEMKFKNPRGKLRGDIGSIEYHVLQINRAIGDAENICRFC